MGYLEVKKPRGETFWVAKTYWGDDRLECHGKTKQAAIESLVSELFNGYLAHKKIKEALATT